MKAVFFSLGLFILVSCQKNNEKNPLDQLACLDVKLNVPKPGEWMAEHPEKAQSFEQYVDSDPISISEDQNIIYIQPIGTFTDSEKEIVNNTLVYVHLFFGLKAVLLKPISEHSIPAEHKRIRFGNEQLDANYITRELLPNKTPKDGIVIMAITATDLYPQPSWNYVFGLANYNERTGVSSFHRFAVEKDATLCLNRTIKTAAHEIGHMFSMAHCKHAVCLMNGVNHLDESDTKPNELCSECLKKLSWNLKFDNPTRFRALIKFFKKHHLDADAAIVQQQLDILKK